MFLIFIYLNLEIDKIVTLIKRWHKQKYMIMI